jgi:hypothetical protein
MWGWALVSCGLTLPDPVVEEVVPARGWNGEDTLVTILGEGFWPQVSVDAASDAQADLDRDFRVFLLDEQGLSVRLDAVSWTSSELLQAVVGEGLPAGTYDLRVVGPTGREGVALGAYAVSDTRADRLALDSATVAYEVGALAPVDLTLLDPLGERVLEDLAVEIRASADDPAGLVWAANALLDQKTLSTGDGISGRLGDDGAALIGLQTLLPQTVELQVTAADPAAGISGDELRLLFETGDDLVVDLALPASPFVAEAGVPFAVVARLEDTFGNLVSDRQETVVFEDVCGSYVEVRTFSGEIVLQAAPTQATAPDGPCPTQRIIAQNLGESEAFSVDPAEAARLRVLAFPLQVRAGDPLTVLVTAEDAFANVADWTGTVSAVDDLGAPVPLVCTPFGTGQLTCEAFPTAAGSPRTLNVTADDGNVGASNAFTVLPDTLPTAMTLVAPFTITAGAPVDLQVALTDGWGNPIDAAIFGAASFSASDSHGGTTCEPATFDAAGIAHLSCVATVAADVTLQVVGPEGLVAERVLWVENGPLAEVTVAAPASVEAGSDAAMVLDAWDAYGNAWLSQGDPVVALADTSGTWSTPSAAFDPTARAVVLGSFTAAGTTRLTVSQGVLPLGESADIAVMAAEATQAAVTSLAPWTFVGVSTPVVVTARDPWDNPTAWTGTVDLVARSGSAPAVAVPLVDGVGAGALVWAAPVLGEIVDLVAEGLAGVASGVVHVAADCADGPVVDVRWGGAATGRACVALDDPRAEVTASLAGSFGPRTLVAYGLQVGDAAALGGSSLTVAAAGVGRLDATGFAIDAAGCGAEQESAVWLGPDDGSAVGPIAVAVDRVALAVGVDIAEVTASDLLDCQGAPAVAPVSVRVDRGVVLGARGTGSGLVVDPGPAGAAVVRWDVTGDTSPGAGSIAWWTAGGDGALEVPFVGDLEPPVVWVQSPEGGVSGPVSEIALRFSEPVAAPPESVFVDAFSGPLVGDWGVDGSVGRFALATAWDPTTDPGSVLLDGGVTDLAGNALVPWFATVGPASAPVDAAACAPLATVFVPDGDDGVGVEADTISVLATSASTPARWRFEWVSPDAPDTLLRVDTAAGAAQVAVVWDGRDASGRVLPAGVWRFRAVPIGPDGTAGPACDVDLTVALHDPQAAADL